jgi:hypothetical protein
VVADEDARAARRLHPAHADVVLDGDGDAAQSGRRGRVLCVQLDGAAERALAVELEEGVERLVEPLGGVEGTRRDGVRRRLAAREARGDEFDGVARNGHKKVLRKINVLAD